MMKNEKWTSPVDPNDHSKKIEELEALFAEKQAEKTATLRELERYEAEFRSGERIIEGLKRAKRKMSSHLRAIPVYLLGRRNIKRLYSRAYKQKDAENKLKMYKKYLYDLGFEERALQDLIDMFFTAEDRYMRLALAWELGLYYANRLDTRSASIAIGLLEEAARLNKDEERKRHITILLAESYELTGKHDTAKNLLLALLDEQLHPDIFIGLANTEETPAERLRWINQALEHYNLQPMTLLSDEKLEAYYRLHTDPIREKEVADGPKVTVIIPAYNAGSGIRVAIESLLEQTWKNMEILVVDDCSTDDTVETIRGYARIDSRVKLLSTETNSGPYVARNIGLQAATGEFITINDADDWSHPEKIAKQVEHLLAHPEVVANTSAHARLTETLKPYRRGMPGKYIFSNMSSLMFRKNPVVDKVGYWDEVRFAADSEFKNRLTAAFGKEAVVDLDSGPLSFPMQSSDSLTANSTFGYNGFLMGARKEYRESYGFYHERAETLYMPFAPENRLFPVPEPMKPKRHPRGKVRKLDVVIFADFREKLSSQLHMQLRVFKDMGMTVGLVQMGTYDLKKKTALHPTVRETIDGTDIQMLVYGETVACDILLIYNPAIFNEKQNYVPNVSPRVVRVVITELPAVSDGNKQKEHYNLRECARHIAEFTKAKAKWYPANSDLRKHLSENHRRELRSISLSVSDWDECTGDEDTFQGLIEDWLVEENPFRIHGRGDYDGRKHKRQ